MFGSTSIFSNVRTYVLALIATGLGTFLFAYSGAARAADVPAVDPVAKKQELRVVFRTSKMHGLINFVETIAGEAQRSRTLKETFEKSPFNDAKSKALLAEYRKLIPVLHTSGEYPGYTSNRSRGFETDKVLLSISAFTAHDNLNEYLAVSGAILPPDVNARYAAVLRGLEPVYDAFVWKAAAKPLEKIRAAMQKSAKNWEMDGILTKAARFYGSDWPAGQPFTVVLYPMPGKHGHSNAESIGSFESVGVFVDADESSLADRYGVMVHEICHSLYEAEPLALQSDLDGVFAADPRPHAKLAGRWLNEGLATALGNGWAASVALGKLDPTAWYSDRYVDGYAHELYPLVRSYVDHDRAMDHEFLNTAVELFAKKFPDAPREIASILSETSVIIPGNVLTAAAASAILRDHFRINSLSRYHGAIDKETIDRLAQDHSAILIAATAAEMDGLSQLEAQLPEIAGAIAKVKDHAGDAFFAALQSNGRPLFIFKVSDEAAFARAIVKMAETKVLSAGGVSADVGI